MSAYDITGVLRTDPLRTGGSPSLLSFRRMQIVMRNVRDALKGTGGSPSLLSFRRMQIVMRNVRDALKGICLIFLSAIYQLFIKYINIK